MKSSSKVPFIPMTLLITGNVLGVGILALPIKMGLSGFLPTIAAIIIIWGMMCYTSLIIAKRIKNKGEETTFDIPSFFHDYLGHTGRWIATIANLILLIGVLTAYLSMISMMFSALFPTSLSTGQWVILYFFFANSLILFGMTILKESTYIIIFLLVICFIILIYFAAPEFQPSRLSYVNWPFFSAGLPIIVSAFHFHNIVPTVVRQLQYDYKLIKRSILLGTGMGLIMNITWVAIVIGGLPMLTHSHVSILYAVHHGEPATVPLSCALNCKTFTYVGAIFALLSVTASYMANGTGLLGFMNDLCPTLLKIKNRYIIAALSFLPPLAIAFTHPYIFLKALSVVGGIGEIILFGILPAIIVLKSIRRLNLFGVLVALAVLISSFYILITNLIHIFHV